MWTLWNPVCHDASMRLIISFIGVIHLYIFTRYTVCVAAVLLLVVTVFSCVTWSVDKSECCLIVKWLAVKLVSDVFILYMVDLYMFVCDVKCCCHFVSRMIVTVLMSTFYQHRSLLVLGDSAEKKTIRFDEIVYCSFAFAWTHLHHYGFVNNGYCCLLYLFSLYILIECWMLVFCK